MRPTGAQPDASTLAPVGFNVSLARILAILRVGRASGGLASASTTELEKLPNDLRHLIQKCEPTTREHGRDDEGRERFK